MKLPLYSPEAQAHKWLWVGDAAPNRSRFRCAYCGMKVETGAPYPSTMATATYDGVRYARFDRRPPCPGPKPAR